MTTIPVYQIAKVDRALDTNATAVRDQKISQTGFSYPTDVPSEETNYTFYAVKESDRKPILIQTGDTVVHKDGTFFYIADNDANPTLQFKDAKELDGKEGSYKVVGLAYIAPPSQDKTRGDRQADDAAAYREVEPDQ